MYAYLTIVRYPKWLGWAGFLSMALFRLPLFLNKKATFYKLLGCGKNGTFNKIPDLRQWVILMVTREDENLKRGDYNYKSLYGSFISYWWKLFNCSICTIGLQPIEGYGRWDGKEVFGTLCRNTEYDGKIAVLTRATIRLNRLNSFWRHVEGVSNKMRSAKGFITSLGIGEVPWIKQATFSIWENKESLKTFAYKMQEHTEVIRKTRQQRWYKEEMFVRFKIIACTGALDIINL